MIASILVPVDGSSASNAAATLALRLAASNKAALHALALTETDGIVNPRSNPSGDLGYRHSVDLPSVSDTAYDAVDISSIADIGDRARAVLDELSGRASQAGVSFSSRVAAGAPLEAVLGAAAAHDLIVVGKTSLRSVDGEMMPLSVCVERLLRTSIRPTLVVPDIRSVAEPGRERTPIIVAFDGSVVSSRTLHLFALLGLGRDREIHVLVQNDGSSLQAEAIAEEGAAILRAHGLVRIRTVGLGDGAAGRPSDTILRTAKSTDAGMIVMGAYGRRGIQEVFGSCTQSVLAGLRTPVFLYH